MGFTAVDRLEERKMKDLSGGERQRVFLARAICQEPDIILLDEPTAALDLAHMERLRRDRAMTVIMVSHDIDLAALYADRMLLLKDGRGVGTGAPADRITGSAIEAAFGCEVVADRNPPGSIPRVTMVPGKYSSRRK